MSYLYDNNYHISTDSSQIHISTPDFPLRCLTDISKLTLSNLSFRYSPPNPIFSVFQISGDGNSILPIAQVPKVGSHFYLSYLIPNSPANFVGSTFKIYPETDFSQPLLLTTLDQVTTISCLDYCNSFPERSALAPLYTILHRAIRVVILELQS